MTTHLTKDGKEFIIRQPVEDDAEEIIAYSKIIFSSTDQTLTTLDEYIITVEDEKKWISSFNQNPAALILLAVLDGKLVGLLFFIPGAKKKSSHAGEFGVSVHPDFQAQGIGAHLIEELLRWAKGNTQIDKVFLTVQATNSHAIRLYQRLGFTVEGRHIKAVKQLTGEYVDVIQMYVETK